MRDIVAVPQSFFCAFFHIGDVSNVLTAGSRTIYCATQHFAAFVDFHFNSKALSWSLRLLAMPANFSFVMLGLVPSICRRLISSRSSAQGRG
ncbi:hypothetical protein [Rhizobium ruizarguesonis]